PRLDLDSGDRESRADPCRRPALRPIAQYSPDEATPVRRPRLAARVSDRPDSHRSGGKHHPSRLDPPFESLPTLPLCLCFLFCHPKLYLLELYPRASKVYCPTVGFRL